MVRAVIGDETHVEGFIDSALQCGTTLQVGLVIGRPGTVSGRDAVFALIPTPQNEGQDVVFLEGDSRAFREAEKKGGTKGKPAAQSLQIDMEWVAEHARQVSKMLVGGIRVMGIYILTSESIFKNSTAFLWQTLKMVALAVNASFNGSIEDLLLLHFSYSPRRVSCRSCSFESGFGVNSFHPCEWKSARTFSTLHSIACLYKFESRVPIYANDTSKKRLLDILLSTISAEASRLQSALILLDDGSLVSEDKALIGDTDHEVELLLPFDCPKEVRNGEVIGLAILSGSIRAHAYGFSRDPLSRAVTDLKADIVKSLRSRLEILSDEMDEDLGVDGSKALHPLQREEGTVEFRCKLPRRLFIPWLEGVMLCDYIQEGETVQDLNSRRQELLSVAEQLDQSKLLEHEDDIISLRARSFWDVASRSTPETKVGQGKAQPTKPTVAVASARDVKIDTRMIAFISFLVLFVSVIASYLITVTSKHTKDQ